MFKTGFVNMTVKTDDEENLISGRFLKKAADGESALSWQSEISLKTDLAVPPYNIIGMTEKGGSMKKWFNSVGRCCPGLSY